MTTSLHFNNGKTCKLTDEQYNIIISIPTANTINQNKTIMIDAIPGSGKTYTLCCCIAYLIEYQLVNQNNIILLTYTKNAKEHMKHKLKTLLEDDKSLSFIGTIHAIAFKFIYDVNNNSYNNFYCPAELLSLFKQLLLDIDNKKKYNLLIQTVKYLFIDEFQDIDSIQLDIIKLIQKISGCHVIYFGDKDQCIYQIKTLHKISHDISYNLTCNFRNSPLMIQMANKMLLIKSDVEVLQPKLIKPNKNSDAEIIHIVGHNTLADEVKYIISYINNIENKKNKKILILSRFRHMITVLENNFLKEKITFDILDSEKIIIKNRITLSTIHGAKGLEADIVILVNAGNINIENENKYDPIEEHNLLYVAITRAKQILHITYHYDLNNIIQQAILHIDNIMHEIPTDPIKPIIFPKNNYLSKGVTEIIKRMTEVDYINIKTKYKITCTKHKIHRSLYEITGKNTLKIMEELSKMTNNIPILLGNYIDHYIGYIINKIANIHICIDSNGKSYPRSQCPDLNSNGKSYHPDLHHIKIIDFIGYNYNIYKLFNIMGIKMVDLINDIIIKSDLLNWKEMLKVEFSMIEIEHLINQIIRMVMDEKILDVQIYLQFIQINVTRMSVPENIKRYILYNDSLLKENNDMSVHHKIIFVNSLITSFINGNTSCSQLFNNIKRNMFIDEKELEWFSDIEFYIKSEKYDTYQYSLHGLHMNGIIDMYSSKNETLADIKCSFSNFAPSAYVMQLLYYYELMKELNIPVQNKVKLYYPLTGIEMIYTICNNDI